MAGKNACEDPAVVPVVLLRRDLRSGGQGSLRREGWTPRRPTALVLAGPGLRSLASASDSA